MTCCEYCATARHAGSTLAARGSRQRSYGEIMGGNKRLRAQGKLSAQGILMELGFRKIIGKWRGRNEPVWVHPHLPLVVYVGEGGLLTWHKLTGDCVVCGHPFRDHRKINAHEFQGV